MLINFGDCVPSVHIEQLYLLYEFFNFVNVYRHLAYSMSLLWFYTIMNNLVYSSLIFKNIQG